MMGAMKRFQLSLFLLAALGSGCQSGPADPQVKGALRIEPGVATIMERDRVQFKGLRIGGDADPQSVSVAWSVGETAVASVDPQGWVTGIQPGTTAIIARHEGEEASALLHVLRRYQLKITPTPLELRIGESLTLRCERLYENGDTLRLNPVWQIRDTLIARINRSGMVTAQNEGVTWIIGNDGFQADSVPLTVVPPPAPKGN